jgi:exonuclease VII small subunit
MNTQITFEAGYTRLLEITKRLDENPGVQETCDLFREGKSLERALREHLAARQNELKEIEQGRGLTSYEIVAPAPPASSDAAPTAVTPPQARETAGDLPPADDDMF